ncbi:hypothetical protein KG091_08335 [Carnobacteriaceae bacterium zg-ZUI78]|nr:hypothetical protein [Carnobacteriaceae bacterium zg-ZUI78]
MKKLVSLCYIETFYKAGNTQYPITKDTIITPAAKDFAKRNGIEFVKSDIENISKEQLVDLLRKIIYNE